MFAKNENSKWHPLNNFTKKKINLLHEIFRKMTDVFPNFLELPKNLHGSRKIAQKSTKKNSLTWRVYDAHTGNRNVNQARELDVSKNKKKISIRLFSTITIW